MIVQRTRGLQSAMLLCNVLLAFLTLGFAAQFTFTFLTAVSPLQLGFYPSYCVVLMIGLIIESMNRDPILTQSNLAHSNFVDPHRIALRQVCYSIGFLLCYLAVMKDGYISRLLLCVYVPSLYLALLVANYFLPRILLAGVLRRIRDERTLLIGSAAKAEHLRLWMERKEVIGLRVMGIINDDFESDHVIEGLPHLGGLADVKAQILKHQVTQVIVLALPENSNVHRYLVAVLEKLGVRLLIVSNLEEKLHHKVVHVEDDGFHFIALREEPLENPLNQLLKRLLDIAVALPMVFIIVPCLMLLVWLIHRLQSPGSLFYRQTRAGIQNRQFQILKFRTMHLNNGDATRQASQEDSRVFPLGRWLRRFSVDEMPQFWNVLKGEMSVVGPRPHLLEHNTKFSSQMANYHVRAFVKPGITGLAQVRGFRGEISSTKQVAQRLESDIAYLESWRIALDLVIILRTVWQMIFPPKTAY